MSAVTHLSNGSVSLAAAARARADAPDLKLVSSTDAPAAAPRSADTVDISAEARAAGRGEAAGGIRQDLVARVKAQIASGDYLSDDKLDIVADRLLKAIGKI